jgi:hypothetical protein
MPIRGIINPVLRFGLNGPGFPMFVRNTSFSRAKGAQSGSAGTWRWWRWRATGPEAGTGARGGSLN